jgi:hypothetical protein
MNVTKENAAEQGPFALARPDAGSISFLGTRNAASDEHQEAPRVDAAAAKQRDWRAFDHQVAGEYAGCDGLEFEQCQGAVSCLLFHPDP